MDPGTRQDGRFVAACKIGLVAIYPVAVVAFDVWLKLTGRNTISTDIQRAAAKRLIIAALIGGGLIGLTVHLFPF